MKDAERKNYQNELFSVAKNTKNALIAQWEASDPEHKYFKDNDTMPKKGALPEGIGITAMLLLLEGFGDDKEVFGPGEREKVGEIINESLRNMAAFTKGGYVATPLLSSSSKAFGSDYGYTDTVTWCLPSAILARYTSRKGKLTLDEDNKAYVMDAIANGVNTLCNSQVNGQWGFRTDTECPRSLYYTYSASAAIADFYDYILGEIALLDVADDATEEEIAAAIDCAADGEVIAYINEKYGYKVREKVKAAREALQNWLIKDALPLFPKVASCAPLDEETLNVLGMWKHSTVDITGEGDDKVFHHLYYTFYLLDMMVVTGVDEAYAALTESKEQIADLAKYYENNKRLNDTDLFYFFYDREFADEDIKNGEYHYEDLFNKNVECALYAARSQYAVASKTGADFWNTAELPLTLSHPNKVISSAISSAKDFKDPSVIAMALRSNITYSYYVTKTQDIAVERLFDDMCSEIFTATYRDSLKPAEDDENYDEKLAEYEEKTENCILDLWDCENYSLALTERSIEALVDFKDYLDRFFRIPVAAEHVKATEDKGGSGDDKTTSMLLKSPFELAMETKIEEYLKSEAGKAIIAEAAGGAVAAAPVAAPAAAVAGMPDKEELAAQITDFVGTIKRLKKTNPDGMEDEKLATALVMLYRELATLDTKDALSEWYSKDSEIKQKAMAFDDRKKRLFAALVDDLDDSDKSFDKLYDNLKTLIDKAEL